jgi:hypothetical protein
MMVFVCEVDHHGLRRLRPEDLLPAEDLDSLSRGRSHEPTAVVRALLEEPDAEDLRTEVAAGRHHEACGLLVNRAVELTTISVSVPDPAGIGSAAR